MPALPAYVTVLYGGSYPEEFDPRVNRTPMEDGFIKQATMASRVLVARPVDLLIKTKANYDAFRLWYWNDIGRVGFFDFTDPRDGVVKQARFEGGKIAPRAIRKDLERWVIGCRIEAWGFA